VWVPASSPAPRRARAPAATLLEKYAGGYALGPGFNLTITREGATLFAQMMRVVAR
jgi:hypothetical protein